MNTDFSFRHRLIRTRVLQGLLLSLGSPVGWMITVWLGGQHPLADLQANPVYYIYLSLGSAAAFLGFGAYVGYSEVKLSSLALTDSLTQLYNGRFFHERLRQEFAAARREGVPLALVVLDLDGFKKVNDQYGHLVGNQLLSEAARNMKAVVREGETLARVGGDEFCVVLYNCGREEALRAARRFRQRIVSSQLCSGYGVGASTGIAVLDEGMTDADALFRAADAAMYQAKHGERDEVVVFSQAGQEGAPAAQRRLEAPEAQ